MKASALCFQSAMLFVIAGMIWGSSWRFPRIIPLFHAHAHLNRHAKLLKSPRSDLGLSSDLRPIIGRGAETTVLLSCRWRRLDVRIYRPAPNHMGGTMWGAALDYLA
jgi:hypothetical protein